MFVLEGIRCFSLVYMRLHTDTTYLSRTQEGRCSLKPPCLVSRVHLLHAFVCTQLHIAEHEWHAAFKSGSFVCAYLP